MAVVEDLLVFVLVLEGLVDELRDGLTVQHEAFGHGGLGSQPQTLNSVRRFEPFSSAATIAFSLWEMCSYKTHDNHV